jgi:hypothetical protein
MRKGRRETNKRGERERERDRKRGTGNILLCK